MNKPRKLIVARRVSQNFFLLLFIYILWSTTYPLRGLLPPETFFRINPLIMILTSISERIILPGITISLVMLFLTLILGRFFCGWVCPLGAVIDGFGMITRKGGKKGDIKKIGIRTIKLVILGIIFLCSLIGVQAAWILDPMGIMARFVSLNLIPSVTFLINSVFVFFIKIFGLYTPIHDFYRGLKTSMLGVKVHYFSSSLIIFAFFLFICLAALFLSRFWCRSLCPLGALYSLIAKFSFLRRKVEKRPKGVLSEVEGCTECQNCIKNCRMGAIKDGKDYLKQECILCMECIYNCPTKSTRFTWSTSSVNRTLKKTDSSGNISRREFLLLMLSSIFLLGFKKKKSGQGYTGNVIRPPGALREDAFIDRCVRCGNCMKVCITNGLQPTMLQSDLQGIWTPHLVPEIGYCEYNCTLCGNVCPTGAIPKLAVEEKKMVRLGIAEINTSLCLPWAKKQECIVCEEHCPIADKAIKLEKEVVNGKTILKPVVDKDLCIGCGICQNKCPVTPIRAIVVNPREADRT